ncbi:thioredoxin [bacterium]|nr:thioredoxin [bacterium]
MSDLAVTDNDFKKEILESKGLVLVDFWAAWCTPCVVLSPLIDEIAQELEGKIKVYKLNVDQNPNTSMQYQVMSIPTIMFFKDGKLVDQMIGLQPKQNYIETINKYLG